MTLDPTRRPAPNWSTLRRLALQVAFAARTYCGYRLVGPASRIRRESVEACYLRQHRKTADAAYRLATRLRGLPIKLCQLLGARPDLLPLEFVRVLASLQDCVPPRPFHELERTIENELGRNWTRCFACVDREPIAAASIAQVHRARLRDGREVALKIQYPDVARLIALDLRAMDLLMGTCGRLERNFDFGMLVSEVKASVMRELDFRIEAANTTRMAALLAHRRDVMVPDVVHEYSTRRVLVTEYVPGVRVDAREKLVARGIDPRRIARVLLDVFCEQVMVHGFFHADPHPGNILVTSDGRVVLIDFGIAKELTTSFREGIADVAIAMLSADRARVTTAMQRLGFQTRSGHDAGLGSLGTLLVQWATHAGNACVGSETLADFWGELTNTRHTDPLVRAPQEVVLVGRVIEMLSGIGRTLGADVDLV